MENGNKERTILTDLTMQKPITKGGHPTRFSCPLFCGLLQAFAVALTGIDDKDELAMPLTGYGVDDTQYMEDCHSPGHSVLHFKQYVIKPSFHHSGLSFL